MALSSALFLTGPQGLIKGGVGVKELACKVVTTSILYCHVKSTRFPVKWDPSENTNGGGAGTSSIEAVSLSLSVVAAVDKVGFTFFFRV